jgi:hypothetical protein
MKQWKSYKAMHKEMRKLGIKGNGLKMAVTKWKNSKVHIIHQIQPNKYFEDLGLIDHTKLDCCRITINSERNFRSRIRQT